jgi:aryl-alcohol dehydrogenase-like predicted oxidoreductase
MEYRSVGTSGLRVSPICLGTMMFGGATGIDEARRIVDRARDAGVNFIDTADYYADGRGEPMVGELIAADRDRWVVATKVGFRTGPGANEDGTNALHVRSSFDRSLRNLRTDRVDLYYIHRDDPTTPLGETLRVVGDLVAAGKVVYWGLSNFRAWRIAEAVGLARELGMPGPIIVQPYYNAMNRQPEVELLPAAAHFGLGVVPYSPLARGVLTGKYRPGQEPPPDSRAGRKDSRILETEWRPESLALVERIRGRAESRGMTTGQFALNWLLSNALITAVLAGPRTADQLDDYLGALEHGFDAEDAAFMDELVPPGYASTYGYHDPQYPLAGRVQRDRVAPAAGAPSPEV